MPEIIIPSKKSKKPEDISIEDLQSLGKDNFTTWCLTSGAKVDNNEIEFNTHRYLIPIYMDNGKHIVWQKAAQLGATVYMLLRTLWWLENHQGRKAGLYFPTNDGVQNLSKDRLTPLIKSCPSLSAIAQDTSSDKLNLRYIGNSSFYLYHLGGQASKDSVPLDYLSFDEVRLCDPKDIDQALHRISHSPYKYKVFMSTCGLPDSDVNARFQRGSMHIWHSACGCPDGCDLARTFPACVISDDPKRPGEVYLRCPKCRWEIKDPQNGRYVALNPSADFNSYHVSQLVSKYRTTKEVWEEYLHTTHMEEFYNAALGIPYIDSANRGVTPSQLAACVNEDIRWWRDLSPEERAETKTVMGVDQGGAYNMAVIAAINPEGTKKRILHIEIIEQHNPEYYDASGNQQSPFKRLYEMMDEFNVGMAVVDAMPNINEALHFAQSFPGRVFLADYLKGSGTTDVVQWLDRIKVKDSIRKAGKLLRFKYRAQLGRFASLSVSLAEWADGNVEIPPLDGIRQMARSEARETRNQLQPESPAKRLFSHLPRLIKRWKEIDPETGSGRWEWIYSGGDPHLAHAWNYANVGLERFRRKISYSFI